MKRFVLPLLVFLCAAFTQVSPVEGLGVSAQKCQCCHKQACGMQGCCPAPAQESAATRPIQLESIASLPAPRTAGTARLAADVSTVSLAQLSASSRFRPVNSPATLAAGVPLFKAHCSFLI